MAWRRSKSKGEAAAAPVKKSGRIAQIRQTYTMTARVDKRLGLYVFGSIALALLLFGLLAWLVGPVWFWLFIGIPFALLAGSIIFGRRAEAAAYRQIEGQPGAAISAMSLIRRGWTSEAAVAVNRQQDVVHRAVGRPGIVLIGEGQPTRVQHMLNNERRRHARIAAEVPITLVVIGNDEGQVRLRKLNNYLRRLPKTLTNAEVGDLKNRLRAMPSGAQAPPVPKGPLPKNVKMPRGGLPR